MTTGKLLTGFFKVNSPAIERNARGHAKKGREMFNIVYERVLQLALKERMSGDLTLCVGDDVEGCSRLRCSMAEQSGTP